MSQHANIDLTIDDLTLQTFVKAYLPNGDEIGLDVANLSAPSFEQLIHTFVEGMHRYRASKTGESSPELVVAPPQQKTVWESWCNDKMPAAMLEAFASAFYITSEQAAGVVLRPNITIDQATWIRLDKEIARVTTDLVGVDVSTSVTYLTHNVSLIYARLKRALVRQKVKNVVVCHHRILKTTNKEIRSRG